MDCFTRSSTISHSRSNAAASAGGKHARMACGSGGGGTGTGSGSAAAEVMSNTIAAGTDSTGHAARCRGAELEAVADVGLE